MANSWTKEQQAAIESNHQNLLLSAAAGSGKTAVLVGRIIARLTDRTAPIAADRLLVVTFTNAAAAEMRERIISALTALAEENPEDSFLANQLLLIKKAQITTIDSFCIDLLRRNFVAANLPPDFRIADPTENAVMRDEVLDEVLTEMYDDETYAGDFFELLESYANAKANDKAFRELIHSLFLFAMSLPNPKEWLMQAAEAFRENENFEDTVWCRFVLKEAKAELFKCVSEYDLMIALTGQDGLSRYQSILMEERELCQKAAMQETYDGLKAAVEDVSFQTRPRVPKDLVPKYVDTVNAMRDRIKKKRIGKIREKIMPITAAQQAEAIQNAYPVMRCLSQVVIRLSDRFLEKKLEKNMLDFNDCEHMCLRVLTDENGGLSETAIQTQKNYDEIYIDEYQDTSRLQEAIFSAVKDTDNLFMVGDIKQSIYRFRNTDPSLFKEKRDTFLKEEDAKDRKIILSKNFRSRENVLSSVNYIFERIMSEESGEIDYNEDEKLYPGAMFPEEAVSPVNTDTELCLVDVSAVKETAADLETEDAEKQELEAMFTADRIADLLEGGEQIFADGVYRKPRCSDICIISRNVKDSAPILAAALSERGIPCFSENTGGFLNSSEITAAIAMLSVIDNPYQDLPLLTVLRSVMFGFTADTLARIRCCDKTVSFYEAMQICAETDSPEGAGAREVLDFIREFIGKSKYMSVSALLMEIYNTTGFYDAQQTQTNGAIRRANLRLLYNRAKEFESTGLKGLYSFIQFISDYSAAGGDFDAAKTVGAEQDAVRIMSIHKSKGLEFPVVILFGMERKFNMMDLKKGVLFHAGLGYGPKYVDTKLRITYPFAPRVALESVLKAECVAEEMRILYVAMTRAKEKLILVGAVNSVEKKVNACPEAGKKRKISAGLLSECSSYLDWILTAVLNHPDFGALRKICGTERQICMDDSRFCLKIIDNAACFFAQEEKEVQAEQEENGSVVSRILPLVEYQYPNLADTVLPSKITVTELKRRTQELEEEGGVYLFQPPKTLNLPSRKLTGAQIGTAYHTVMQHMDLSLPIVTREDVHCQIQAIQSKGFLTGEEAGAVNPDKILKFFLSNAGKLMLDAKTVRREVMFGVLEPANELLKEFHSNKKIMLQGVIDCVAETDDGLCIIDYKTDRTFRPDETVEKYKIQLECYKMAAEKIFHKRVVCKILYLFDADMAIFL